jgi:hypothetical protein
VQASSHQLRELEKKLRVYLSSRVLVFRKGEIGRHQIKFNSRGYVSAESGSEFASPANAILFIDLTLTSERAVISGEAVRVRPRTSQPNPLRYSREFKLVTCTIILDVPPGELTLARMIGILCRVFLTREELARTAFHPRGYEPSNFLPGTLP